MSYKPLCNKTQDVRQQGRRGRLPATYARQKSLTCNPNCTFGSVQRRRKKTCRGWVHFLALITRPTEIPRTSHHHCFKFISFEKYRREYHITYYRQTGSQFELHNKEMINIYQACCSIWDEVRVRVLPIAAMCKKMCAHFSGTAVYLLQLSLGICF